MFYPMIIPPMQPFRTYILAALTGLLLGLGYMGAVILFC